MGPLIQFIFYLISMNMNFFNHYQEIIKVYNYTILGFNLLPIYPLDGGKLVNILLSSKISFKKSLSVTLIISSITLFIFTIYFIFNNFSLNIIIVISFLIYKISYEWKNKKYTMDKFLLERYLYKHSFKKRKEVNSIDEFMRNKNHIVKINNKYYTEKDALYNKFNK